MSFRINVNLYPKSGYRFKDQNGVVHIAGSWAGVMRKVAAYRRRMGQPPGDVAAEVTAQACSVNPAFCREDNKEHQQAYRKASLKGQVLQFLALAREHKDTGKLVFVQPQDAVNRANVCAGCPFNQQLPGGCSSCRAARKEAELHILGRQRRIDERLGGCLVLGEDLPTAAHLERVVVDNAELPGHCWRKKTL